MPVRDFFKETDLNWSRWYATPNRTFFWISSIFNFFLETHGKNMVWSLFGLLEWPSSLIYFLGCPSKRVGRFFFNLGKLSIFFNLRFNFQAFFQPWRASKELCESVCVLSAHMLTIDSCHQNLGWPVPFLRTGTHRYEQGKYQVPPPFCLCSVLCNSGLGWRWCRLRGEILMKLITTWMGHFLTDSKHFWSNSGSSSLVLAPPVSIFRAIGCLAALMKMWLQHGLMTRCSTIGEQPLQRSQTSSTARSIGQMSQKIRAC